MLAAAFLSRFATSTHRKGPCRFHRKLMAGVLAVVLCSGSLAAQEDDQDLIVRQLKLRGNESISGETIRAVIATTNSSFFATSPLFRWIRFLGAKRTFNQRDFEADVERLKLLYRKSGFMEVQVDTTVRRTERDIFITFDIEEGPPTRVLLIDVTGLDSLPSRRMRQEVTRDLPLRVGEPFNRFLMQATADTLIRRLQDRGYPTADVFQNFAMDRDSRTAEVGFDVFPGTRSVVGPIEIAGTQRLDTSLVRSLLWFERGDRYSQEDLFRSQRNLYRSDLFRYAAVSIDTTRYDYLSDTVPMRIQVIEGRFHRVRWGVGYGTDDCFRASAGWAARNFLGRGRILEVSGRMSKIGIGAPFDAGMEDNLCSPLNDPNGDGPEPFSRKINYNTTVSLRQPAFLSPKNTGAVALFAERRSSPNVYEREEFGTSLSLAQILSSETGIDYVYRWSRGITDADDASFCAYFAACQKQDIDELRQRRNLGTASVRLTFPRANSPINPTRGYLAQFEATLSSKILGSDDLTEFARLVADWSWYQQLSPDHVLSWRLRGGMIFAPRITLSSGTEAFIPPDQRFYAGGSNDVRGYGRNELGPVVYVIDSAAVLRDSTTGQALPETVQGASVQAIGGNTLAVGNVELRMPTGISPRLRFALFLDAGSLWVRDEPSAPFRVRFTPGLGLRYLTPLGPARIDFAYNPYDFDPGRLLVRQPNGDLIEEPGIFQKERTSGFLGPWTIHISVGNAF